MPKGIPPPEELTSRHVGAFALDTSVIQGSGFSFSEGRLARLADQLPPWLQLWMPDIVAREVMHHRMEAVRRAIQQVRGAQADLRRLLPGLEIKLTSDPESLIAQAAREFDAELRGFITEHSGKTLQVGSADVSVELFQRYFAQSAPFGGGRDKKHEFPDAVSLLVLQEFARRETIKVIAVSADRGWMDFAAGSDSIYCVPSLDDLTKFFVASSARMQRFADRLRVLLAASALADDIRKLVQRRAALLPWIVDAHGYDYSVDAGVVNVVLERIEIREGSLRLWATSVNESACVAEVVVEVDAKLEIEAYAYQNKYKSDEKEDLASTRIVITQAFELTAALEFKNIAERSDPLHAVSKIFLLDKALRVDLGRPRFPGLDSRSGFFDLEDDIPF